MRVSTFMAGVLAAAVFAVAPAAAQNPLSVFYDDFSVATGWNAVSPDWQIGGATASSGENYGNPDPSMDASGVLGGPVAGVILGGNAPTALNGKQYFESPVVPSAGFPGLGITFERWLNSDYTPFMQNGIDVWDEATLSWVNIWATGGSPGIQDSSWTTITHDVSAYASNTFQVRFWYEVGSSGVFTVSSWNIDNFDVHLLIPGNGQPSQPGVASLDIDGSALSPLGNPVSSGDNGIYNVAVNAGAQMEIQAQGASNQPWVLLGGAPNEGATSIAPFGQLDLGTSNFGGLEVIGSGLDGGFFNAFFVCDALGVCEISLTVPPSLTGITYGLQGVMVDPALVIVPTNAVAVTFN